MLVDQTCNVQAVLNFKPLLLFHYCLRNALRSLKHCSSKADVEQDILCMHSFSPWFLIILTQSALLCFVFLQVFDGWSRVELGERNGSGRPE